MENHNKKIMRRRRKLMTLRRRRRTKVRRIKTYMRSRMIITVI